MICEWRRISVGCASAGSAACPVLVVGMAGANFRSVASSTRGDLLILGADLLEGCPVRSEPIRHDLLGPAMPFHELLEKLQGSLSVASPENIKLTKPRPRAPLPAPDRAGLRRCGRTPRRGASASANSSARPHASCGSRPRTSGRSAATRTAPSRGLPRSGARGEGPPDFRGRGKLDVEH